MDLIPTDDSSYTLFSKEYNECYHSSYDGALSESLYKHIIPAFKYLKDQKSLTILDICYGLGYNTLGSIYYNKINNLDKKLKIISPELDEELVKSLIDFEYPKEFEFLANIIKELSINYKYKDDDLDIKIIIGDAREYLQNTHESFDILYQDAFSPSANPMLWTKEYFSDIVKNLHDNSIITTYSTSTNVRLSMYENGINIYHHNLKNLRDGTLGLTSKSSKYQEVDMELKKLRNKDARALRDSVCIL